MLKFAWDKLKDSISYDQEYNNSKADNASLYIMTETEGSVYNQRSTKTQISNITVNVGQAVIEKYNSKIIYDILNPKFNHDFDKMK